MFKSILRMCKNVGQTIRAIRVAVVEMVRLQEYPEFPSRLSYLYTAKSAMKTL